MVKVTILRINGLLKKSKHYWTTATILVILNSKLYLHIQETNYGKKISTWIIVIDSYSSTLC
jgi:hypothetical protein